MFAFDETKEYVLIKMHTGLCTRKYMYVVIMQLQLSTLKNREKNEKQFMI